MTMPPAAHSLSNQVLPTNDEENPGWIADIFGGAAPIAVNGNFMC